MAASFPTAGVAVLQSGGDLVADAKDALQYAHPLPSNDDMAIEGLTAEECDAFEQALADR